MVYKVDFLESAAEDVSGAVDWYAEISIELAEDFLIQLGKLLETIRAHPKRFQKVHKEFRKLNMARFPYKVIYRIEKETVLVLAVAHHKRRPAYWKKRK